MYKNPFCFLFNDCSNSLGVLFNIFLRMFLTGLPYRICTLWKDVLMWNTYDVYNSKSLGNVKEIFLLICMNVFYNTFNFLPYVLFPNHMVFIWFCKVGSQVNEKRIKLELFKMLNSKDYRTRMFN